MLDVLSEDDEYYQNLFGARDAIPRLLDLFRKYSIAATWAPVGMLFNENIGELVKNIPALEPHYENQKVSVYTHLCNFDEQKERLYFASDLIKLISECPKQEIATHTYSHYYCTEPGQTKEEFEADIQQAVKIMIDRGYDSPYSLIFPRNMCNDEYLYVLDNNGIRTYRGETEVWYTRLHEGHLKKVIRLVDAYINIGGHECYELERCATINIPASRFLYPYGRLPHLDWLKIHRIERQMKYAAVHKKVFHLWWHPHNFGMNTGENLRNLEVILDYYTQLREKYNMESVNMKMLGEKCLTR